MAQGDGRPQETAAEARHLGRVRRWSAAVAVVLVGVAAGCSSEPRAVECGAPPTVDAHMTLVALDAATGVPRWRHGELPLYANGYTHLDGSLVVVSRGVTGETFDLQTGSPGPSPAGTVPVPVTVGARKVGAPIPASVRTSSLYDTAVFDDHNGVVVDTGAGGNGQLVGFDPVTTEQRWTYALDRPSHSNLLLQDGIVVVTTGDDVPMCP